jgi:Cd2+/Zn2+-exporting ATPase
MAHLITEKFYLKNLDCANCAGKIERGLNKIKEVSQADVDFANLTLNVKTTDLKRVIETVAQIDAGIELIHQKENARISQKINSSTYHLTKEIGLLVVSGVLFVIEVFIKAKLGGQNYILIELPTVVIELPTVIIELSTVIAAYLLAGWNVFKGAFRTLFNRTFFDENILMVIATIGAIAIHAYLEAVAVMIFFKVGEVLQQTALSRSRRSIHALLAVRPDKAVLKTADGLREVTPKEVAVGEKILIKPGEKVPLDGQILNGQSRIDGSPITGESRPLVVREDDMVMAGQINKTGVLTVRVTKSFSQSSIAKIMDLVENAATRKANTEKFITTFARYYTPAVVFIAFLVATVPTIIFSLPFETWVYRALVILVISCPCALVVSIPLGYFGGIGRASKSGILVKGSNFIDALSAVKTVVFDKTGTLTKGDFKVNLIEGLNGYSQEQLLELSAAAEYHSTHPIAVSILEMFRATGGKIDPDQITEHMEISGEGVSAKYQGKLIVVGSDLLLHRKEIAHSRCSFNSTVVHVAVDGDYAGYLMIGDQVKDDARPAMEKLRNEGVDRILMLTGDNRCAAEAVAHRLNLDHFYAELLPEEKVTRFEHIGRQREKIGKIAFVGDGINDAPVIARADVGVAMGALGSDAAIETADVVLMTDSLSKMAQAVAIAKQTRRIVWQNIGLTFFIKIFYITLGAMGLASMWSAVFADMGTALLALFNSSRILKK